MDSGKAFGVTYCCKLALIQQEKYFAPGGSVTEYSSPMGTQKDSN